MRKAIYCFCGRRPRALLIATLFYCFIAVVPVRASDSWKSLPANTCPAYPVVSACNLTYIMETNVATLGQLVTGANQGMGSAIGLLYQVPPVSGRDFVAYMSRKFHVPGAPTPAYAAIGGVGYNSLTPVLKIWVAMRNLAYFAFAIVFIVVGVMILIRSKIDPKTTINIQNALPKIVLALILVTFSYAIAGFLIDLMYVAVALIVRIFVSIDPKAEEGLNNLLGGSIFQFVFNFGSSFSWWEVTTSAAAAVNDVVSSILNGGQHQMGIGGNILGLITSGLAFLIVGIAILWALVKTWLALIGAYANIILGIIFSPLQLMADAIPGQNQFEGWLKNMLANLLSFPAVLAMMAIGSAVATNFGQGITNPTNPIDPASGFVPPLLGAGTQQAVAGFVGLGILLTIPKAVEMLQEVLKAPKSKWGSAWGEAVKFGQGVSMAGAGKSYGFGRDYFLGKDAAIFEEARKKYFAGAGPKPAAVSRGGIGHALGAKPN